MRRATAPRRRRGLSDNLLEGPIPPEIGELTALRSVRVPPAYPKPGASRDRPSASQVPPGKPDHRPDPGRVRPAHGADGAASSPRVPDARRAARPPLVAGTSPTTRSPARSRSLSATSRLATPSPATTSSRRAARRTAAISGTARRARPRRRPSPRPSPRRPSPRRPSPRPSPRICRPNRPASSPSTTSRPRSSSTALTLRRASLAWATPR